MIAEEDCKKSFSSERCCLLKNKWLLKEGKFSVPVDRPYTSTSSVTSICLQDDVFNLLEFNHSDLMQGSVRCPLYWPWSWPCSGPREIPFEESPLPTDLTVAIAVKGSKALLVLGLIHVLAPGREWMSGRVTFGEKLVNDLHWSPFSCWQVSGFFIFFFPSLPRPLFDSVLRSLLKCSLTLALGVFHRQISACVILNPKHSISSSLPARATRIQLEKPHVVILIF